MMNSTPLMNRLACLLGALALSVSLASPALAEDLPNALQARILLKVMNYDQTLGSKKVAVLYAQGSPDSEAAANAVAGAVRKAGGAASTVAYQGAGELPGQLGGYGVLFVAPGLSGQVGAIASAAAARHVLTASGSVSSTRGGLVVGLASEGDKPKIFINISAAKRAGAQFASAFLNLAEIIR